MGEVASFFRLLYISYIKLAEGFSIMALFSVYFDEKDEEIKKLIESNYADHMFIHDGYCIIKANVTSQSISGKLGIWNAETKESSWGVVLKLNGSYSGYADGEIWNWLDDNSD